METVPTPVSFIEHLLAVPKTSDEHIEEFEAKRLDVQLRLIDLDDFSNSSFADKSTLNT